MAGADDRELNSLSRYEKRSPDLALLEYSHCEVPAGCGGAVLRWLDPRVEIPLALRLHAPSRCEAYLDGVELAQSLVSTGAGPHVLAFHVAGVAQGEAALVFVASRDDAARVAAGDPERLAQAAERAAFRTEPGATWRVTTVAPAGDAWMRDGFDDSAWSPAVAIRLPKSRDHAWILEKLTAQKAQPIGLRGAAGPLWIRRRFVVDLDPAGDPR